MFNYKYAPFKVILTDGNPVEVELKGEWLDRTVWWAPVSGDTIQVRYKVAEDAPWITKGSYTDHGYDGLLLPIYKLEFQRTAGSGTTSVCGYQ